MTPKNKIWSLAQQKQSAKLSIKVCTKVTQIRPKVTIRDKEVWENKTMNYRNSGESHPRSFVVQPWTIIQNQHFSVSIIKTSHRLPHPQTAQVGPRIWNRFNYFRINWTGKSHYATEVSSKNKDLTRWTLQTMGLDIFILRSTNNPSK